MSLHRVCCCDVDTCADDWDFFDCCSGRRNYIDGGGTTQQASTMGVSLKRFYLPAGELVDSYGSGLIHITSFPRAAFMIGGQLNYGEPSPNNYDYFGAKAGNWPTPSSGSSGYAREIKLREFAQFGNNWDAGSWKTYSSTNVDEVLRGIHTPTATGTFDRLELSITGPVTCTSAGCRLLASSSLVLSSAAIAYEIACGAKWYRCTDTDGALDSSCDPVTGEYPDCCEQCPQDLDVRISSLTRPQNYVFGNGCGVPADVQAAVEATDPTQQGQSGHSIMEIDTSSAGTGADLCFIRALDEKPGRVFGSTEADSRFGRVLVNIAEPLGGTIPTVSGI